MRRTDTAPRFRFGVEASTNRALQPGRLTRLTSRWRYRSAVFAVVAFGLGGTIADPAYAVTYPTWQDVQNAKSNADSATAKVAQLNSLIGQLESEANEAQRLAVARGAELQRAQEKFDEADYRAAELERQAAAGRAKADTAIARAGRLAAQLHRSGGSDATVRLLLGRNGDGTDVEPDRLLSRLGSMSKLVQQSRDIYVQAKSTQNSARALAAQADVAKSERQLLRASASEALDAASIAAQAAAEKAETQRSQLLVMQAQLAALKDVSTQTVTAYQAGAAERAKQQASSGGAGLPGGHVGPQGWAVPAKGKITDGYGPRPQPCPTCSSFHRGVDIGAACYATIYSAAEGTVVYSGPQGTYGNFVLVDNGSGVSTGYAHILDGGLFVKIGQRVSAGEAIASVGTTGASTGCHLHYEVRINGSQIDGVPFMKQRGAPLG